MAFDTATLNVAVMLVMLMSSLTLLCNWLANKLVEGLFAIFLGSAFLTIGVCTLFGHLDETALFAFLLCQFLGATGHALLWLGVATYWQMPTKRLVTILTLLVGILPFWQLFLLFAGHEITVLVNAGSMLSGGISVAIAVTLLRAIGGPQGLYKGVVRRAKIGAVMAFIVFLLHGIYSIFSALPGGLNGWLGAITGQPLAILTYFEMMMFAITVALVIVIMTAERLQAELNIQELIDPLTKALKQHSFMEVVRAVLARSRRSAEPVSLIMMDINQFKRINLDHGRDVGDAALVAFSRLVMEGRRGQDVFCRFGGEEFVLMLPGTAEEGAALVASRIRTNIENTMLEPEGVPVQLSISMGVVTARGDDLDVDGMLDMVNRQMSHDQKLQFELISSAAKAPAG